MEKVLILGGTNFIGRVLVEELIKLDQFDLTLLNRGETNPSLFKGINKLVANRNTDDIGQQIEGDWDYILDLSCYFPKSIELILASVSKQLKKYIFISTCSVYNTNWSWLLNENGPVKKGVQADYINEDSNTYGIRKARCEELLKASGLNYTIFRPALVYGKYDPTDRFYYWLHQVKKYDTVLLPKNGERKVSLTYVYDLVQAILLSINPSQDKKAYNMVSTPKTSLAEIVQVTSNLLDLHPTLLNAQPKFLKENGIAQWEDIPLWINSNFFTFGNGRLRSKFGLNLTSMEKGIEGALAYYDEINWPVPKYGIDRKRQLELIALQKKA